MIDKEILQSISTRFKKERDQIPNISFDFSNPPPDINRILPRLLKENEIVKTELKNGIMKIWTRRRKSK